jgi:Zn-dependent metalloprotease
MKNRYLKTIGIVGALFIASLSFGQQKQQPVPNFVNPFQSKSKNVKNNVIAPKNNNTKISIEQPKPKIETINGSFSANLEKERLTKENAVAQMPSWFGLSQNHTFQQVSERTDELGITHTNYQQYFKGFLVEGNLVMLHSKNGKLTSLNGQVAEFENIEMIQTLTGEQALSTAKNYLKVTELINNYPIETVITRIPSENGTITKLAQKVRIDSYNPFTMCYVYIDAETGNVLNKINLIAHADVPGTGQTLYSGNQSITCDSYSGSYRLRENGRKIETYNATNATNLTTSGFTGSTDFTSNSTTWTGVPILTTLTISAVAQSWWYASFADELPDLYIKIKDGSNQTVFTSNYTNNTNPPLTFNNLSIYINNPPYTLEIWDYDAVGGDDFGGSYTINANVGTQNWSGSGNNGSYVIATGGHPALDVHWGMEKSYDFYLNVFSRNSYDGAGSIIKQYVNPPTLQSQYGNSPNNAGAYPAPYNLMQYGLGDGSFMKPVVGLDVEGHEFTHLVVDNNGNGGLVYQGESGALNESFADIFGTCIEFYSGVNADWLIGEDVMIGQAFMRSMSNPNGAQQPDTYNGQYWTNTTNLSQDNGGVHTNSGVQNFWFYLLSQGGSGTNDLGNSYSVTAIGIAQAREIAYRNLVSYLGPNATFMDAYNGSLQAAQDLYGNPSAQYTAVREAWYAVGIGNDPNNFCSGTTNLIASSGTITDGSGSANYNNNANCKWVISPAGATQIQLTFTVFDTESDYDTVFVYDGPDETFPVLATWWGNTLPSVINTTSGVGAMCVRFTSDFIQAAGGWSANYQAYVNTPNCGGGTILSTPTGSFNDGSAGNNYGNNQECYWFISPPCASSVTLSFSQFNTEQNYDGIVVFSDLSGTNQLAVFTGTTIPSSITSNTGVMLVVFFSDYIISLQGFTANYTSTGSAYCSGTTNLNTSDYATFTDGSGGNNYCNNQDCKWLIQPPQATSVTLNFTAFELENASSDGTIYDAVEVYDGTTTSATLLGRFTGNNLPPTITSSGGSMLVRFISDLEENKQGFSAYYTSTQNPYCTGTTTNLTSQSGTFADGSASYNYANNTSCYWLIQPTNTTAITLSFSAFNTELNYDGVIVYDGANNTAPVLGQFSGTSIPNTVTSTGGSMYVEFLSDPIVRGQGWTANYTSTVPPTAAVLSGSATICAGASTNLSLAVTGGTAPYTVTVTDGTNNYTATGASPVSIPVSPTATSTYTIVSVTGGATGTGNTGTATVTVTPSSTNTTTITACDSYVWNGTTYTSSGTYTGTTANCVTQSLNLTIIPSSTNTTTVTACNNYAWNGTTYTSSGVYTGTTTNCVTESLNLTINPNTSSSISQTALDSYTWPVNSQTYTTTGAYTAVIPNASGCDSTITLNLTMSFTGINDLSTSKLSIYPNPTNGDFTITGLELLGTVSSLSLTDMNGKVVKVLDTKATKFSMASIKPGVYFLNIITGNKQEVLKIVKE